MVYPTKSLPSVGLAQARPNNYLLTLYGIYSTVKPFDPPMQNTINIHINISTENESTYVRMCYMYIYMCVELEIRTEKCSDTNQYNIKFVLTFTKIDLTLNFGLDTCQIKVGIAQVHTKSGPKMLDLLLLIHALQYSMCIH